MDPEDRSRRSRLGATRDGPAPPTTSRCLHCGRGEAVRSPTGALCPGCERAIAAEVQERVWIIQESLRTLKEEPGVPGMLREWDLILAQVEALQQYEARAILTTCPPPSTLLRDFQAQRDVLARLGWA